MERVQYLGYIVDKHSVHVDLAKIQAIRDQPTSTTLTEIRSFLGLANFYCRFVLGFYNIAWSVSQVTKGGSKAKLIQSKRQQHEFEGLKQRSCSVPILTLLDLHQPFEIDIDALNYDIGAVLTFHGHSMAYNNETLSDTI